MRLVVSLSSKFVGASCEVASSSIRAIECSRKSCLVAMSREGRWAVKERNWVWGGCSWCVFARPGASEMARHFGACHEAVGLGSSSSLSQVDVFDPIAKEDNSAASLQSNCSNSGAPARRMQRPRLAIRSFDCLVWHYTACINGFDIRGCTCKWYSFR